MTLRAAVNSTNVNVASPQSMRSATGRMVEIKPQPDGTATSEYDVRVPDFAQQFAVRYNVKH
ncbi:hypothetical protein ACFWE3_06285 [Mycobacteriaceae bacterium NPDC060252]